MEDGRPVRARIDSFPYTTRCADEVKNVRCAWHARHCQHTAAAKRPNLPPAHRFEKTLVNGGGSRARRRGSHGRARTRRFLRLVECEATKQESKGAKTLTQLRRGDEHSASRK